LSLKKRLSPIRVLDEPTRTQIDRELVENCPGGGEMKVLYDEYEEDLTEDADGWSAGPSDFVIGR
jgi:hypothetical protein